MPRKRKEEVPVEPGKGLNLDPELIKQLVPGTLDRASINEQFAALKKAIFERALGGELTHHLGYEKGEAKPRRPHEPSQRHQPQAHRNRQ
ncbi:hypothetical protein L0Y97_29465 [Burkholderia multivorans]|uniref:hypothetical protein n=1 Tax=Burkholderia multivorans TaxID=87883 RepID=UPI00207CCC43|nr:hypothetical protein [Burkholderia multivorans]MCO1422820.1 hypothetical protein [Burkholderia multivorans]